MTTPTPSRYDMTFIPDQISIATLADVSREFREFEAEIENQVAPSRSKAVAMTKLQECYHWVKEAIREDQEARNRRPAPTEGVDLHHTGAPAL